MENLCSEILIAEPWSTFYLKNIFVESDTILSSSPTERKKLQLSVYHFNTITFFCTSSAQTVIFHTNVIATICRSSQFLPFLQSSLLLLKFQTRTHTSRKWCHVIWQTDTNVAQETAASICSSQHTIQCFPWHCLLQNISHLFSFLKSLISPHLLSTLFYPFFSAQQISWLNYSPGFSLKSSISRNHDTHSSTLKMEANGMSYTLAPMHQTTQRHPTRQ